jgi:hypothetical protein
MNQKANLFGIMFILFILLGLLTSCGPASAEAPVATEEPAGTEEIPISDLVVVLVVDNFTDVEETETENDTCTVTPDGQGLSGGRGSSTTILGAPHGFFVYEDLVNQISPAFTRSIRDAPDFTGVSRLHLADSQPADLSFIKRADLFLDDSTDKGILVVAVDTNGFNFNDISMNIPRAIELFSSHSGLLENYKLPFAERIVVNMSFVFVPCDLNSAFASNFVSPLQNNGISGTYESVEALNEAYFPGRDLYDEVNAIPALISLKSKLEAQGLVPEIDDAIFDAFIVYLLYDSSIVPSWLNSESLKDLQSILSSYSEVIYVGAAGNFGYPYPFVPASWDFVISVSSEGSSSFQECRENIVEYSNCAEVQLDGDYWELPDSIYGTSFAAPKFSAKVAQHLLVDLTVLSADVCPVVTYNTGNWDNALYTCSP